MNNKMDYVYIDLQNVNNKSKLEIKRIFKNHTNDSFESSFLPDIVYGNMKPNTVSELRSRIHRIDETVQLNIENQEPVFQM